MHFTAHQLEVSEEIRDNVRLFLASTALKHACNMHMCWVSMHALTGLLLCQIIVGPILPGMDPSGADRGDYGRAHFHMICWQALMTPSPPLLGILSWGIYNPTKPTEMVASEQTR